MVVPVWGPCRICLAMFRAPPLAPLLVPLPAPILVPPLLVPLLVSLLVPIMPSERKSDASSPSDMSTIVPLIGLDPRSLWKHASSLDIFCCHHFDLNHDRNPHSLNPHRNQSPSLNPDTVFSLFMIRVILEQNEAGSRLGWAAGVRLQQGPLCKPQRCLEHNDACD